MQIASRVSNDTNSTLGRPVWFFRYGPVMFKVYVTCRAHEFTVIPFSRYFQVSKSDTAASRFVNSRHIRYIRSNRYRAYTVLKVWIFTFGAVFTNHCRFRQLAIIFSTKRSVSTSGFTKRPQVSSTKTINAPSQKHALRFAVPVLYSALNRITVGFLLLTGIIVQLCSNTAFR